MNLKSVNALKKLVADFERGKLLPDEFVLSLIEWLATNGKANAASMLAGYRTVENPKDLAEMVMGLIEAGKLL